MWQRKLGDGGNLQFFFAAKFGNIFNVLIQGVSQKTQFVEFIVSVDQGKRVKRRTGLIRKVRCDFQPMQVKCRFGFVKPELNFNVRKTVSGTELVI